MNVNESEFAKLPLGKILEFLEGSIRKKESQDFLEVIENHIKTYLERRKNIFNVLEVDADDVQEIQNFNNAYFDTFKLLHQDSITMTEANDLEEIKIDEECEKTITSK